MAFKKTAISEKMTVVKHNHHTRDIKAPGVCPGCDAGRAKRST